MVSRPSTGKTAPARPKGARGSETGPWRHTLWPWLGLCSIALQPGRYRRALGNPGFHVDLVPAPEPGARRARSFPQHGGDLPVGFETGRAGLRGGWRSRLCRRLRSGWRGGPIAPGSPRRMITSKLLRTKTHSFLTIMCAYGHGSGGYAEHVAGYRTPGCGTLVAGTRGRTGAPGCAWSARPVPVPVPPCRVWGYRRWCWWLCRWADPCRPPARSMMSYKASRAALSIARTAGRLIHHSRRGWLRKTRIDSPGCRRTPSRLAAGAAHPPGPLPRSTKRGIVFVSTTTSKIVPRTR